MNERIGKLLSRSGGEFFEGWFGSPNSVRFTEDELKTFIELIVEECVGQCWTVSEIEQKGYVISECSKKMRKHFGVEE